MAKWALVVVLVIAAAVGGLWYRFYRPQQQALAAAQTENRRLQSDLARCDSQGRALAQQLADLQTARGELQKASADLQQKVKEKEDELSALRGTQDELVSGLKKEIESNQIQVQRYRDQLRVDVVDEVLFDSGDAEIKAAGQTVLAKVADALKKAEGRNVDVQGHTDNVPIVGALARRYPTNWELSAARAVNVVRFLQQAGLPPERLSATGRSEYQPKAANDTDEGRHKNRRIEILLGPRTSAPAASEPGA